jgi:hypothetical protein
MPEGMVLMSGENIVSDPIYLRVLLNWRRYLSLFVSENG